jgi:hypothetical protein
MADTTTKVLQRVLEEPGLVAAVQSLPAAHLDALVRAVGLEDAGELLAMVTPAQFGALVDDALWQASGRTEAFDHARFPTWLEVMFEGGDELVARRLAELDEEILAAAFSGQLFVLDAETLGIGMAGAGSHEAELAEKALDACLYLELHDYTLVARRSRGWDAVIGALLALDQRDHELVLRILDACRRASTEFIEDSGGLYETLTASEAIEEDARAGRDDRRAVRGFVSRADALAFLKLAESPPSDAPAGRDAITAAYFREYQPTSQSDPEPPPSLTALFDEVGITAPQAPALPSASQDLLRQALASLPADIATKRHAELAYLANVLVASGRHSPVSAARTVVEVCARGLTRLQDEGAGNPLEDRGCDLLFRRGSALG